MSFPVSDEEINELVGRCSELYLGLEATPTGLIPNSHRDCKTVAACVHILGSWLGTVSVEVESELADKLTRKLFELPDDEAPSSDLVIECLKEFANTTGGNVKASLGGRCVLSTPKGWALERGWEFSVPEAKILKEFFYTIPVRADEVSYLVLRVHESMLALDEIEIP